MILLGAISYCFLEWIVFKIAPICEATSQYGDPMTPYQRVLDSQHISDDKKLQLRALHSKLDPLELTDTIHEKLKSIQKSLKEARAKHLSA